MGDGQVTEETIRKELDGFRDPETGRGVVRLGQVHGLELRDGRVSITLGLTTYAAPLWETIREDLASYVREKFPELGEVAVDLAVHERPAEKVGEIGLAVKSVIAIGAGKGGVGK